MGKQMRSLLGMVCCFTIMVAWADDEAGHNGKDRRPTARRSIGYPRLRRVAGAGRSSRSMMVANTPRVLMGSFTRDPAGIFSG